MKLVAGYADVDHVDDFVDSLSAIAIEHDCTVQAVDARYVAGRTHLSRALELADRAIDRDAAIARDRGVEVLLYVTATRQIERAFEIGVSEGRSPVVVLVDDGGASLPAESDPESSSASDSSGESAAASSIEELLDPAPFDDLTGDRERIRDWFEITDEELAATECTLEELVRERVALLVLET